MEHPVDTAIQAMRSPGREASPAPRPLYRDRWNAGRRLADALASALDDPPDRGNVRVFGMPRGGVVIARALADSLRAPLDVIVARKLGVPGLEEVALGAIAEGRRHITDDPVGWFVGVPRRVVAEIATRERAEIERRVRLYRHGHAFPDVRGCTVVLADDGLATGATLRAAALALRRRRPRRIIAAVPVASPSHCGDVRKCVDELIVLEAPEPFHTVSAWYEDFTHVTDAEVLRLLRRVQPPETLSPLIAEALTPSEREVYIPVEPPRSSAVIIGDLGTPNAPRGLVILAHGGGSSRQSYRNRYLAGRLRMAGWATLRVDLLLEEEQLADDEHADLRFDVARIGQRLRIATEWAARELAESAHRIVLFGASTGAAAAMLTAAARPDLVAGVISRGGRVDLAGSALDAMRAPTLMIVGGADVATVAWNEAAARRLRGRTDLKVVPGAGHTFEEPGTLGVVGEHAVRWLEALGSRVSSARWLRRMAELVGAGHLSPQRIDSLPPVHTE